MIFNMLVYKPNLRLLALLISIAFIAPGMAQSPARNATRPPLPQSPIASPAAAQAGFSQFNGAPIISKRQLSATVDPEIMRGYKALQQNQFSQAREAYSLVLTRNATQRDALLGIAYAHHALGDTTQAIATLRQLVNLYPRDSDAISALFLIAGGDLQEQETRLKQLLERSERPAALHYALGVVYFEQNRFGEAERAFDRAFSMEPEQPDYAYNWAVSLDRLGRLREAARQYVVALNLANQTSSVFSREVARSRLRILTSALQ
jgi:Flp pilus assembly protein TadD